MKNLLAIVIVLAMAATPAVATDSEEPVNWDGILFGWWQVGYPTASGATFEDGDFDGDGDVDGLTSASGNLIFQ